MFQHLTNARYASPRLDAPLYVIGVVFNPLRYQSRQNLYREFLKHASDSGAIVSVVELTFGERQVAIASSRGIPRYDGRNDHVESFQKSREVQASPEAPHTLIQLQTDQELWHKEAMINVAVSRLPQDWKYVAWVDADVTFVNPDWVHETMQQLQHYPIVQMFTHAFDVGPDGAPINNFKSFAYSWLTNPSGLPAQSASRGSSHTDPYYYGMGGNWHPGFGWAYTRDAWNTLGGMLDINIVGGGDYQMSFGLVGEIDRSYPFDAHQNYINHLHNWQTNALRLKKNIGAVPGTIAHHWHGPKVQRGYFDRWKILQRANYDPYADLRRDWQLLYQLSGDKPQLRDDLRAYFRQRNEDSTSLI